jgi:DNA primase
MSWYKTKPNVGTLLVEDVPSAARASKYLNTVALLGTGIGLSRAAEIAEHATRPVIVALDQDATGTSFKWARKYALLWGDVQVLPLKQDIKNMTEEQLQELLG